MSAISSNIGSSMGGGDGKSERISGVRAGSRNPQLRRRGPLAGGVGVRARSASALRGSKSGSACATFTAASAESRSPSTARRVSNATAGSSPKSKRCNWRCRQAGSPRGRMRVSMPLLGSLLWPVLADFAGLQQRRKPHMLCQARPRDRVRAGFLGARRAARRPALHGAGRLRRAGNGAERRLAGRTQRAAEVESVHRLRRHASAGRLRR